MEPLLFFIALTAFYGVPIYLVYLLIKEFKQPRDQNRVHVGIDPADKARGYIAGGDRTAKDRFTNALSSHPQGSLTLSSTYKPKAYINAKAYSRFHYDRKSHIMTQAERNFYKRLEYIFPRDCYIFPQVHIDNILKADNRTKDDNWKAWAHVRAKSVDYVVCDNEFRIKLAIELDDWSHDFETRKHRDAEVERIFEEARVPLLRCRNINKLSDAELRIEITEQLDRHRQFQYA